MPAATPRNRWARSFTQSKNARRPAGFMTSCLHGLEFEPRRVDAFEHFGGDRPAKRPGVFAGRPDRGVNARRIVGVECQAVDHIGPVDVAVFFIVAVHCAGDFERRDPGALAGLIIPGRERHPIGDIDNARHVFGALGVARHPVQLICDPSQHGYSCNTQVSLVPPPCDELTTREPSVRATRVSPPGTTVTSSPERTNGRRSTCRGATPDST